MNKPTPSEAKTLPLYEETISVGKRRVRTGTIHVRTVTDTIRDHVDIELSEDRIDVKRVPVDRVVDHVPEVRIEGDLMIVPVLKEVFFVEKRLVLAEEIHLRRWIVSKHVKIPVERRSQRALVQTPFPEAASDTGGEDDSTINGRPSMTEINESVHYRLITAFYDNEAAAQAAVDKLLAIGIPNDDIHFIHGRAMHAAIVEENKGFWEIIKYLFLPEEDRHIYAEGLKRGGYLVSVRADDATYGKAFDILDSEGTLNLTEQEALWRAEGWTGYEGALEQPVVEQPALEQPALEQSVVEQPIVAGEAEAAASVVSTSAVSVTPLAQTVSEPASLQTGTPLQTGAPLMEQPAESKAFENEEMVIPIAEELLHIGKREIDNGRVRVHSYTVTKPASASIKLREENITIERHPVDRPITATDNAFAERTIELDQHAEVPVVEKDVHVSEEIRLAKDVREHQETVSDSVRETKVDIEDTRRSRLAASTGLVGSDMVSYADKIHDHMNVMASDGQLIGVVDHLEGDRIMLTSSDSPDHLEHFIPLAWVKTIGADVELDKPANMVKASW
ncbi:DUF2382 domain-containing protein [Beijerinckia indica]|uniref:DUF2382 domain-containing protein n=1 Tax=Beijerinckia indica subsp. indica (strain ATCC 9039 / DSM 1715 / NCIMB 8712) TaxID=395963 RepID=B2IBV7_BEII9|nr:DUF2382 domain-containing protein [Beijerinckia indica]ACB93829.1 hypothetical protein Bind_0172 [Beijerinckia indica subsp. indica ATCC 9039]